MECNCCNVCKNKLNEVIALLHLIMKQTGVKNKSETENVCDDSPVKKIVKEIENKQGVVTRSKSVKRLSLKSSGRTMLSSRSSAAASSIQTALKSTLVETLNSKPVVQEVVVKSKPDLPSKQLTSESQTAPPTIELQAAPSCSFQINKKFPDSIIAAKPKKNVFVKGLDKSVLDDDLKKYVCDMIPGAICHRITPKPPNGSQPDHVSYRIQVPGDLYKILMDKASWPEGVIVTEYIHKNTNFHMSRLGIGKT